MRISDWSSDVCSSDLDLMVTRRSDGIYIVVNGATKYDDIAYLREHLPDEITINHMDEQALLALQGPKAIQALSRLVAGVDDLVFMQAGSFCWRDHDLWISRSGYTGEDGFEISLPADAITRSERRVGKECVSTCRYRWSPDP